MSGTVHEPPSIPARPIPRPDTGASLADHTVLPAPDASSTRYDGDGPGGGPRPGLREAGHILSLLLLVLMMASGLWQSQPLLAVGVLVLALAAWAGALREREARSWWFVYVGGMYLYSLLRALADDYGLPIQVGYVIALEEYLFDGEVPTVRLQDVLFSPRSIGWVDTAATLVHWSFFVVPHAVAGVIWWRSGTAFPRYVLTVMGTLYVGLAVFFLLPTAPPWLASTAGEIPGVYRVIDVVGDGLNAATYQQFHAALAEPNSVASVPSIHMALTFTLVLWARRRAPRLLPAALAYSAMMALSLVYLGEHYAVDLVAGALLAGAVDMLVHRRTEPEPVAVSQRAAWRRSGPRS